MQKPRLLDEVRQTCRDRHNSICTEKAYIHWIKRYLYIHNQRKRKRSPESVGYEMTRRGPRGEKWSTGFS
jgi:hypothetical protein